MKKHTEKFFRNIDPNRSYAWHWLPSQGRSAGILYGLKKENFDIVKVVENDFAIEAEVLDKKLNMNLRLVTTSVLKYMTPLTFFVRLTIRLSTNILANR
jgi:hypothetical protein